VTSLLIMEDGKILFERYRCNRRPKQRFFSWSTAKSITALLVGITQEKGLLQSLDDKAAVFRPASAKAARMARSAFGTRRAWVQACAGMRLVSDAMTSMIYGERYFDGRQIIPKEFLFDATDPSR
jgi:hypothetical protein